FVIASIQAGSGRHAAVLAPEDLERALYLTTVGFIPGILSFTLPKYAVVMLVSKLFNASRLQIWTMWSMAVLNTLLIIACIVVVWARCSPPSAMWTIGGNPDCWDPQIDVAIGIAAGVFSAVFDFYLAIYPGIVLWRFPINLKKKIVLSTALGFGFFFNGKFDHLDEVRIYSKMFKATCLGCLEHWSNGLN
ncbi:hypothetical protein S7711_00274, partial [Stachybotrys chartarum IBT 7711]